MSVLTRPILEINLDNLEKNYRFLQTLAQGAEAAAVVKDDAYGLGAETVAERLYENAGCRTFFVAHGIEGEKIRPHVPNAKIYVLQGIGEDSLASFERANLIPVIAGREQLAFWKEHKIKGIKPAIQIETGLNRLGFRENELTEMSPDDRDLFSLVLSHLACADEQGHFMNEHQLQNFNRLRERFFPRLPASLSASDGTFLGQDYRFDVVRLGAAMYGINTAPYRENQMLPVVRVMAPVLEISALSRGDFVGYSATYRAAGNRKIAIVSIGYGDGVPRALSNVGKLFFYNGESSDAFPWTTSSATLPKWKTCMSATWLLSSTNFTLLTTSAATPAPSDMKCCPESAKTDALNAATSDREQQTGPWCALFRRQNPG